MSESVRALKKPDPVFRFRFSRFSCTFNKVLEVAPNGKTVWEYSGGFHSVLGVHRLENGNTLIVDSDIGVIEVTPSKKIVWKYKIKSACDVFRLPNGNTIITQHQRAIEITPEKKIVWSRDGFRSGSVRR